MNSIQNSYRQINPDLGIIEGSQELKINEQVPTAHDIKSTGFLETLSKSMEEVNTEQLGADQAIKDLVAGKSKNIHETMIQIQKAELSLKTMMQVRNKILEAYKEIMRMQV